MPTNTAPRADCLPTVTVYNLASLLAWYVALLAVLSTVIDWTQGPSLGVEHWASDHCPCWSVHRATSVGASETCDDTDNESYVSGSARLFSARWPTTS